ncbi:hypothetical protein AX14_009983 [Amanita brunnescens Koide BX004]|nr:hypothetical protein AX14_009983 [Amanita brunnescens Koide BX004]
MVNQVHVSAAGFTERYIFFSIFLRIYNSLAYLTKNNHSRNTIGASLASLHKPLIGTQVGVAALAVIYIEEKVINASKAGLMSSFRQITFTMGHA